MAVKITEMVRQILLPARMGSLVPPENCDPDDYLLELQAQLNEWAEVVGLELKRRMMAAKLVDACEGRGCCGCGEPFDEHSDIVAIGEAGPPYYCAPCAERILQRKGESRDTAGQD